MIHSTFSIHAGIWTKGLRMAVTQLYESYGLDANTYVETPVELPESPSGHVQNGSESTNVQMLVPTDCVLNLTDVLPLDLPLDTTQQSHTSPVQTSTLAREGTRSYHSYTPGLSSDKVVTSKKSVIPATPLASRRPRRCCKPRDIYFPSMY